MGKIKNKARLHAKAAKLKAPSKNAMDIDMEPGSTSTTGLEKTKQLGENIFSKLDIDVNTLQRNLTTDGDDTRSTITSKSLKGLNLKKKDKRRLRHHLWLKKVETLQEAKKEAVAKKKRQQTVIVGDMKPLEDTLPTLELLLKDISKPNTQPEKLKPTLKEKQRKKQMLEGISTFKQVLQHPVYRNNPLSTIKEHLQNTLAQGNT